MTKILRWSKKFRKQIKFLIIKKIMTKSLTLGVIERNKKILSF
jgi:hypothetical protein